MPGRIVHFEIPADDTARAREFYGSLFGWSFQSWDGPMEYHMTQAGGDPGGAIYPRQENDASPRIWFDTDDLDAQIARVRELGGEATEKDEIPGVGWFTMARDTEGNRFGIIEPSASMGQDGGQPQA